MPGNMPATAPTSHLGGEEPSLLRQCEREAYCLPLYVHATVILRTYSVLAGCLRWASNHGGYFFGGDNATSHLSSPERSAGSSRQQTISGKVCARDSFKANGGSEKNLIRASMENVNNLQWTQTKRIERAVEKVR